MTEKTKAHAKPGRFEFGTFLLIAGAAVNIPRWMGVFIPDTSSLGLWMHQIMLPVLDAVAGALMGIVAAGAVMYVFHALGNTQRVTERTRTNKDGVEKKMVRHNERWYLTAILGVGILAVSVYILQPYAESVMPGFVRSNVGNTTLWSYLAVLASEMIIAAVALADKNAAGFASSNPASNPVQAGATVVTEEHTRKQKASKEKSAIADWISAHAHEFHCKADGCKFDAVAEAMASGKSERWSTVEQAQDSLTKSLNAHGRKHKVIGYMAEFTPVIKDIRP